MTLKAQIASIGGNSNRGNFIFAASVHSFFSRSPLIFLNFTSILFSSFFGLVATDLFQCCRTTLFSIEIKRRDP